MVAWAGDEWVEPCRAFRAALQAVGWTVRRNRACLRAVGWPVVAAEASYPGEVRLVPEDCFPEEGAVFTDGSVSGCGGAAAVEPSGEVVRAVRVLSPRSSTHCELVALALALALEPPPPQVLSDSLVSLRLLERWGTYPARRALGCQDRMEVRRVVHAAECLASPPLLMKVKAHDVGGLRIKHPMAMGNDAADRWAREAASGGTFPVWGPLSAEFGDPVELVDSGGRVILSVATSLGAAWWQRRHRSQARARPWMEELYHEEKPVDWALSTALFRRPVVSGGSICSCGGARGHQVGRSNSGGMFGLPSQAGWARACGWVVSMPLLRGWGRGRGAHAFGLLSDGATGLGIFSTGCLGGCRAAGGAGGASAGRCPLRVLSVPIGGCACAEGGCCRVVAASAAGNALLVCPPPQLGGGSGGAVAASEAGSGGKSRGGGGNGP